MGERQRNEPCLAAWARETGFRYWVYSEGEAREVEPVTNKTTVHSYTEGVGSVCSQLSPRKPAL